MNIDESKIESAITDKTKAIVPVHYAGVSCEMDTIMDIASRHNIYVIEDAAQGMMSTYKGKALGTIGHLGAYSFHETKNYTSGGEGGLLIINDDKFKEKAEIIREKGTNRSQFFRGIVDKYSWVDIGSSYLPSDIQAAYLWGQLEKVEEINNQRLEAWLYYYKHLKELESKEHIKLPTVPNNCKHNAHMFYIKVENLDRRTNLIKYLKDNGIMSVFHYIPLHSSIAGKEFGSLYGEDKHTTTESEKVLRLPMFYNISQDIQNDIIVAINKFYC
jgi:dTDP-4-amino-4,6-dideoxygalactose transaminase